MRTIKVCFYLACEVSVLIDVRLRNKHYSKAETDRVIDEFAEKIGSTSWTVEEEI